MRWLFPLFLLLAAAVLVRRAPSADARPEFARREAKACGYCHINPRGGGARNQNGLRYARNEFSFPVKAASLAEFTEKDRARMARARKLVDLDHVRRAVTQFRRLAKSVKGPPLERVMEELHQLDVRGEEILGQARRLLRKRDADDRAEGVELLVLLKEQYKDLDIGGVAATDLREIKRDRKEMRDVVKAEEREAKARLAFLDAVADKADGKDDKAKKGFEKILKSYPGTRAEKDARRALGLKVEGEEGG